MTDPIGTTAGDLYGVLAREGFAFVTGDAMRSLLERVGPLTDWDAFAESWNDLPVDTYLVDHGRYRRRRHAVFNVSASGAIERAPHRPHHQHVAYNPIYGGIERWFDPIDPALGAGACMTTVLSFARQLFGARTPEGTSWGVEVHQFRIEARLGEHGQPTPEGVHRDGVDHVLVLLIARTNIASGTTTIHTPHGAHLGHFTLTAPLDAALVDDARVCHGVTPVEPIDPSQPAHRDVLVVTFRKVA